MKIWFHFSCIPKATFFTFCDEMDAHKDLSWKLLGISFRWRRQRRQRRQQRRRQRRRQRRWQPRAIFSISQIIAQHNNKWSSKQSSRSLSSAESMKMRQTGRKAFDEKILGAFWSWFPFLDLLKTGSTLLWVAALVLDEAFECFKNFHPCSLPRGLDQVLLSNSACTRDVQSTEWGTERLLRLYLIQECFNHQKLK